MLDTFETFALGSGDFVENVAHWRRVRDVAEGIVAPNDEVPDEGEALSIVLEGYLYLMDNLRGRNPQHPPTVLLQHISPDDRYPAQAAMLILQHHSPFADQELTWLEDQRAASCREGFDSGQFLEYLEATGPTVAQHLSGRYRGWLLTTETNGGESVWYRGAASLSLTAARELHRIGAPLVSAWYATHGQAS